MDTEAKFERLFEPGKIGKVELKNRIVMPPMATFLAQADGRMSRRQIDYYVERARGGVSLIIVEATPVDITIDQGFSENNLPRLDSCLPIPSMNECVRAVHEEGAKIAVQLTAGPGPNADLIVKSQPVAASPISCFANPRVTARELTIKEIERLVEAFGDAAHRARLAGFDAIEIHGHVGYLIASFMSPSRNKRTDRYGGDLEGRLRFPLEVVESIKDRVGEDLPISFRMSVDELAEGGRGTEESQIIAKRFEEAGVNAIHADAGVYESMPWIFPPTYFPQGCMVQYAEAIKDVVNIPVIAVGKIRDPEFAEKILREGRADFVAIGRALIADPGWPNKAKEGRLGEIRRCISCNEGCVGRVLGYNCISCALNPAVGREEEYRIKQAEKSKVVLIVGGGPGGMEAARVAALRGHKVTLCEKRDRLGGQLIPASVPQFKEDLKYPIEYFSNQVKKLGVETILEKEVTPEMVEEMKPDVVVIATGGIPLVPEIPGVGKDIVVSARDILLNKAEGVGERVVVVGGGLVGCEVAVFLAKRGKKVTIVEMLKDIAPDVMVVNRLALLQMLSEGGVEILTDAKLEEIINDGIVIVDRDRKRRTLKADTVVLALGLRPERGLLEALAGKGSELYAVGDCMKPRKIIDAIHEASSIARRI